MPITLILAIIDLIIKLPSIIQTIRDIIAAIHLTALADQLKVA